MTHIISKDFLLSYSSQYTSVFVLQKELFELRKAVQSLREEIKELKNIIMKEDHEYARIDTPKIELINYANVS